MQTTVFVVDLLPDRFTEFAPLHAEYFGDHCPVSTICGVVHLAFPGQLVEFNAVVDLNA